MPLRSVSPRPQGAEALRQEAGTRSEGEDRASLPGRRGYATRWPRPAVAPALCRELRVPNHVGGRMTISDISQLALFVVGIAATADVLARGTGVLLLLRRP